MNLCLHSLKSKARKWNNYGCQRGKRTRTWRGTREDLSLGLSFDVILSISLIKHFTETHFVKAASSSLFAYFWRLSAFLELIKLLRPHEFMYLCDVEVGKADVWLSDLSISLIAIAFFQLLLSHGATFGRLFFTPESSPHNLILIHHHKVGIYIFLWFLKSTNSTKASNFLFQVSDFAFPFLNDPNPVYQPLKNIKKHIISRIFSLL